MKSKTKALKKGNYIPGTATPAPAKKAEKATPVASNNHEKRNLRKEAESRSRARRMRSMLKLGMTKEEIDALFEKETNRMILVLINGNYTIEDGTKTKKKCLRDKQHKVISTKEEEVPNVLHGINAAQKFAETQNFKVLSKTTNSMWVLSDAAHVENDVEKLKILGRVSVTKPETHTKETEAAHITKEKKTSKKPTNNTAEAKTAAKAARKAENKKGACMRPYYAALRKGGVSARIKKHNPSLAEKIEQWLTAHKKDEAKKAEQNYEYRKKHRQLTSLEAKANKRARRVAKQLETKKRVKEAEAKRAKANAKALEQRATSAKKPVQTKLKMSA